MRFLSFSQPWLWSIVDLQQIELDEHDIGAFDPVVGDRQLEPKRVENRSWMPPVHMIGQRIALHAAKSWDDDAAGFFLKLGVTWFPARRELYTTSAVVAVATIDTIVTEPRRLRRGQKPWFFGPAGWVLADVRKLSEPVPMKGAQGLREMPAAENALVLERIPA